LKTIYNDTILNRSTQNAIDVVTKAPAPSTAGQSGHDAADGTIRLSEEQADSFMREPPPDHTIFNM
jgi:hypothetical protein